MFSISTIDGRYKKDIEELQKYMSEYALMETRYYVELAYLEYITKLLVGEEYCVGSEFNTESYRKIKEIESVTNHDVKAVEYYIRSLINDDKIKEFVHFGLTSHDINNVSNTINIRNCIDCVIHPILNTLHNNILNLSEKYLHQPMLSHTHGQPATPTTMGKEMYVFCYRLQKQLYMLDKFKYTCKFGGAVGSMNAHYIANNDINWIHELTIFINELELSRDIYTTQLNSYDNLSELLGIFLRISTILIDFCQDLWLYISMDYFKLKIVSGEVGSSTMPHKVNPIFFENAEGNLGLANSLIQHFQTKLPVSRLQRDLTDSTVIRNIGLIFGYILKATKSILKGIDRLDINIDKINSDLNNNWSVVTEAIQTILRFNHYADSYDKLKEFSRNNKVTRESLHNFIDTLDITYDIKNKMKNITPHNYLGFLNVK